jgi:hypothetical protein
MGIDYRCKACKAQYDGKWRWKNPDKVKASSDKFYLNPANKQKKNLSSVRWQKSNPDKVKKISKKTRLKNRLNRLKNKKDWDKSYAKYDTYSAKLTDIGENITKHGDYLLVSCHKCGQPIRPTNKQCYLRIGGLGRSYFYCSDTCKYNCDEFNRKKFKKNEKVKARECLSCHQILPAEHFYKGTSYYLNVSSRCKECVKKAKKTNYIANREKIAAQWKAYRERNPAKIANYNRAYREKHTEKIRGNKKNYYEKNRGQIAAKGRVYREQNQGKIAAYMKDWNEKNREYKRVYSKLNISIPIIREAMNMTDDFTTFTKLHNEED